MPEERLRLQAADAVDVADAAERLPGHGHAQVRRGAATAPGIRPSPQALSMAVGRGSTTDDVQPGAGAVEGGGQPGRDRRPRSAGRSRRGARRRDGGGARSRPPSVRAAFSQPIRTRSSSGVEHGEAERGHPGRVHQRQRDPLRRRPPRSWGGAAAGTGPPVTSGRPGTTITRVFQRGRGWRCTTSAGPGRPRRRASIDQPSSGTERPAGHQGLHHAARQQRGVQDDHDRVVAAAVLATAPRQAPRGVARDTTSSARRSTATTDEQQVQATAVSEVREVGRWKEFMKFMEFTEAPAQQDELGAEARTHRQQQPGPPGGGGPRAGCPSSTCRTEADERLPTAASDRRVSATVELGKPQRVARARRGSWGRRDGRSTRRRRRGLRSWSARKLVDVVAEVAPRPGPASRRRARCAGRSGRRPSP